MSQEPQTKILIKLVTMKMPYGKYKGRIFCDLPECYLSWAIKRVSLGINW